MMANVRGRRHTRAGQPQSTSRRQFLTSAAATAGACALAGPHLFERAIAQSAALPSPERSGIEHIVVVMMENRSFDHLLGWLEGADGRQAGLTYLDSGGTPHVTHPLAPDFQGCGHADPDHSYQGGRIEYNGGACDGWLRAGNNDEYAIGFYTKKDLDFLASAAKRWTVCDRYFAAIMAETFPNRIYQHAAQTDRLDDSLLPLVVLPTIWDRLADAGLDGRYYFSDIPFLALWGPRYVGIGRRIDDLFADAAAGRLPQVAFVDPKFLGETEGTSNDDHPFGDVRAGEAFLNRVYSAVTQSPAWLNTLLIINFDEWGGFFDHVPPTAAPIPLADQIAGNQDGLRGFRTPCLVVSPFSRQEHVSSLELDHTSVLRLIEWRWNLAPLTVRDGSANNLAEVLDFGSRDQKPKEFKVPSDTLLQPCLSLAPVREQWQGLRDLAIRYGWNV